MTSDQEQNIFHILQNIRQAMFYKKNIEIPDTYKLLTVKSSYESYKWICIEQKKEDNQIFVDVVLNLISFPTEKDEPNFHPKSHLILNEFGCKFSMIDLIQPGLYSIIKSKNKYTDIIENKLFKIVDESTSVKMNLSNNQINFINKFLSLYQNYSFPTVGFDGQFDFFYAVRCAKSSFTFFVPHSQHEVLKGLESNFIPK